MSKYDFDDQFAKYEEAVERRDHPPKKQDRKPLERKPDNTGLFNPNNPGCLVYVVFEIAAVVFALWLVFVAIRWRVRYDLMRIRAYESIIELNEKMK